MKVIIVGATGNVGAELIRQSLRRSDITSVVAVSRRPLPSMPDEAAKLKPVIVKDYDQYDDEAKQTFAGANACIWTIAVTPMRSAKYSHDELYRINHTATLVGMKAMHSAGVSSPFRFLYMSGVAGERDQTKTPSYKPEYSKMRGQTENEVLAFAVEHNDVEASVAKPGLITKPGNVGQYLMATGLKWIMGVPSIGIEQISKAMLDQVVYGFEKDPLMNEDLIRLAEESVHKA